MPRPAGSIPPHSSSARWETRVSGFYSKITPVFATISTSREKQNKNPQAISRKGEGLRIFYQNVTVIFVPLPRAESRVTVAL